MSRCATIWIAVIVLVIVTVGGCGNKTKGPLGSEDNPIKMALVPSLDSAKLLLDGKKLSELLNKETGLHFEVSVPSSYTIAVMGMGSGKVDVGWLSPLPYVLAHDRYGVRVVLTSVRDNSTKYWSFIIARNDSGISKLSDLKGKRFAYGDSISTSGAIYPKHLLRTSGYDPEKFFSQVVYAGSHDKVIMDVYNRQVDGGAIYGGVRTDAREKVLGTIKDIMQQTHVVARSAEIPNDTVSVRKGLSPELTKRIADALLKITKNPDGRKTVLSLYGIDGFVPAKDSDYDSVRDTAKAEKVPIEQAVK